MRLTKRIKLTRNKVRRRRMTLEQVQSIINANYREMLDNMIILPHPMMEMK